MTARTLILLAAAGTALSACATTGGLPPAEAIRYHLGPNVERGTVAVQPVTSGGAPPSLEYRTYADAVSAELARNGYPAAAAGARPQFVAVVDFRRGTQMGPPRSSPISIGIGGGGFSGGRRGGGVGLGGGVGFPIGGGRARELVVSELNVTIKRNADQSPVWEGSARAAADSSRPEADTPALAQRLATALFTNFPGESGRTIEVK
jgi:hypothetical protein